MEMTIRPMTKPERMYCYTQSPQIRSQTGNIGYLRADMDTDGKGFYSSWFGFGDDGKTDRFKEELDGVIGSLRFGEGAEAFLKDRKALAGYCFSRPETFITEREAGVRIDTEEHAFLLRLNPDRGEYNLYCYCYRKDFLDRHLKEAEKGIRFVDTGYRELFRIPDGGKIRITYPGGERREETCRYIDPYHVEVGYGPLSLYHVAEFAEHMEKSGAKAEPLEPPEKKEREKEKASRKEERVIWDSEEELRDWEKDLEEELPDASEEERWEALREANRDRLLFIREELSKEYPEGILVAADLGLWDGRRTACREIRSGRLSDCFEAGRDTLRIRWYVDGAGDLRADDTHHDGVNHYLYRAWKEGTGEEEKIRLKARINGGSASKEEIGRATCRLGDDIGKIQGWTVPERKTEARAR